MKKDSTNNFTIMSIIWLPLFIILLLTETYWGKIVPEGFLKLGILISPILISPLSLGLIRNAFSKEIKKQKQINQPMEYNNKFWKTIKAVSFVACISIGTLIGYLIWLSGILKTNPEVVLVIGLLPFGLWWGADTIIYYKSGRAGDDKKKLMQDEETEKEKTLIEMEKYAKLREKNIQTNKQRIISQMESDIKLGKWKNLIYHTRQFNPVMVALYAFSFGVYILAWIIFVVFLKQWPLLGFYSTIIPLIIGAVWASIAIIEENHHFFIETIEEYADEHQYQNDYSHDIEETVKTLERYNPYLYILSNNQEITIVYNIAKCLLHLPWVLLAGIAVIWILYYLMAILNNPINIIIILLLIIIFMLFKKGKKI